MIYFGWHNLMKVCWLDSCPIDSHWQPTQSHLSYQVKSCSDMPGYFKVLHVYICWQDLWKCWFPFSQGHLPAVPCARHTNAWFMITASLCLNGQTQTAHWKYWAIWKTKMRKITSIPIKVMQKLVKKRFWRKVQRLYSKH